MGRELDFLQFPKIARTRVSTERARKIARKFGKEFFDGKRENGYGGYRYDGRWRAVAKRMKKHYKLGAGDRVLDVGCGKGFLVNDFLDIGLETRGIDISEYAISQSIVPEYTEVGNAKRLPFFPKSFDLAVSINTIHNLELDDCVEALAELSRVSKHQYVVLDAYTSPTEEKRIRDWNLTARTILHVNEWLAVFRKAGYKGDYHWTLMR